MTGRRSRLVPICLALLARFEKDRLPKLFIRKERTHNRRHYFLLGNEKILTKKSRQFAIAGKRSLVMKIKKPANRDLLKRKFRCLSGLYPFSADSNSLQQDRNANSFFNIAFTIVFAASF